MAITIPGTAVNYPIALLAVGLKNSCVPVGQNPVNGPQCIPAEINWGTMGGTDKIVGFNIGNAGATRAFTDLCALVVDNSLCGAEVEFVFTDTQFTYTIPAYCPYALIPIFTKALQFYVISKINGEVVESNDLTRFLMFNFVPPPVVIPAGAEQNSANASNISSVAGSTTLVAAGTNGTLENAFVFFAANFANSGNGTWKIQDGTAGTPAILAQGTLQGSAGDKVNLILYNMAQLAGRFTNGLYFVTSQTAVLGGTYSANVYYRTP